MPVRPAIIPALVYDDAPAAIEALCRAFGFTRHAVYANADGSRIDHAQLLLQGNMIMLGSTSPEGRAKHGRVSAREINGLSPIVLYVVIDDVDTHHAVAQAAGAEITTPPHDNDYGGRSYEAHDCEGNSWSFGSYDPFALAC